MFLRLTTGESAVGGGRPSCPITMETIMDIIQVFFLACLELTGVMLYL